jgi:hypothetical protein
MATTRECSLTGGTYVGGRDVAERLYDALMGGGILHRCERQLCRELADLAGSMYQRRSLSDADIDDMVQAAVQD